MNAAVQYVHNELETHTMVSGGNGTVKLAIGLDTPRGWAAASTQLSANDARHLAELLQHAAEAADD